MKFSYFLRDYFYKSFDFEDASCCSIAQLCLTLCDPMDCSTPGLPVHHQLPVACSNSCPSSPTHPLPPPPPPAFSLSQHQGLFQ